MAVMVYAFVDTVFRHGLKWHVENRIYLRHIEVDCHFLQRWRGDRKLEDFGLEGLVGGKFLGVLLRSPPEKTRMEMENGRVEDEY